MFGRRWRRKGIFVVIDLGWAWVVLELDRELGAWIVVILEADEGVDGCELDIELWCEAMNAESVLGGNIGFVLVVMAFGVAVMAIVIEFEEWIRRLEICGVDIGKLAWFTQNWILHTKL
jgi:hypothetical protein